MSGGLKTQGSSTYAAINRLKGITATFDTFLVNPSTPLNMTDGDFTTVTGEGTKSQAGVSGTIGNIKFDMGASYPVLIVAHINAHRASGDGDVFARLERSDDGVGYPYDGHHIFHEAPGDNYKADMPVFIYGRYFRIIIYSEGVTVNPSVFHVRVAEVQALQFL